MGKKWYCHAEWGKVGVHRYRPVRKTGGNFIVLSNSPERNIGYARVNPKGIASVLTSGVNVVSLTWADAVEGQNSCEAFGNANHGENVVRVFSVGASASTAHGNFYTFSKEELRQFDTGVSGLNEKPETVKTQFGESRGSVFVHVERSRPRETSLWNRIVELFQGDEKAAEIWVNSPLKRYWGLTPNQLSSTIEGAREVEAIIDRFEQGIF
jgi:hypothetical protein